MRPRALFLLLTILTALSSAVSFALYSVSDEGSWPSTWPPALESLRSQSRTLNHRNWNFDVHEIPFTDRKEFESAWPHILRTKSKGAPLILLRSPDERMGETFKAGVRILSPLTGTLVTPDRQYPPGAESSVPDGKFLRIGPPWPNYIKSESGALPEHVVCRDGKWVPHTEKEVKQRDVSRARTDIELVVDGDIVDLNRISLPPDALIIDKRFAEGHNKAIDGD
jgi:hypothetical protein